MYEEHIEKIEDIDFQVQFLALAGVSVLLSILERHDFVRSLIASIRAGEVQIEAVYERLLYALPRAARDRSKSWDGSIVVYHYCLAQFDSDLAYAASKRILDTTGLFWSRRQALRLLESAEAVPAGG